MSEESTVTNRHNAETEVEAEVKAAEDAVDKAVKKAKTSGGEGIVQKYLDMAKGFLDKKAFHEDPKMDKAIKGKGNFLSREQAQKLEIQIIPERPTARYWIVCEFGWRKGKGKCRSTSH